MTPHVILLGPAHPYRGGIAYLNERLAHELNQIGLPTQIWTFRLLYPQWLFPGKTQFREDPPFFPVEIHRRLHTMFPWNWVRVGWALRRLRPRLVIYRYWLPHLAPLYGTIARIANHHTTRHIGFVDNADPHEPFPGQRLLSHYFFSAMDGFITLSRTIADQLHARGIRQPIVWSPHPLYDHYPPPIAKNDARRQLNLPTDVPLILFFGLVRRYKGLDLLLHALAHPSVRTRNVHLLVAGEFYDDPNQYHELIRTLHLNEVVHIHDWFIPDHQVHLYFSACDLVVLPYREASQSGVTQVAYFYQKPMLVTRVGGLPEQVAGGTAGLIANPTPEDLAHAIHRFFTDPHLSHQIQKGIQRIRTRFSWQHFVCALLHLYQRTMHP